MKDTQKDEASSAAAHPGDPLSAAPDGPERRSPARPGEGDGSRPTTDSAGTGDSGRARYSARPGDQADPGLPADSAPRRGGGGSGPVIAVDAMGGDHAPDAIVAGALAAQREHGVRVVLTGPAARLRQLLGGLGAIDEIQVVPAEDNLAMDEGALASLRRPRSSVAVACQLVRRGDAAAVVSAGSTGGIVAIAR
ncbi:MAG: hypothetical protein ACRDND_31225, partial [Streptosporangiaceae bacterium]